jgi:hypothetical protein
MLGHPGVIRKGERDIALHRGKRFLCVFVDDAMQLGGALAQRRERSPSPHSISGTLPVLATRRKRTARFTVSCAGLLQPNRRQRKRRSSAAAALSAINVMAPS